LDRGPSLRRSGWPVEKRNGKIPIARSGILQGERPIAMQRGGYVVLANGGGKKKMREEGERAPDMIKDKVKILIVEKTNYKGIEMPE